MNNEKQTEVMQTCPHCGKSNAYETATIFVETDDMGKNYAIRKCICTECEKEFYQAFELDAKSFVGNLLKY